MAYSTPRTWVAGEYVTAAELNANVRDDISFLGNPPACRVFNSGSQSIAHNTETALTFDSERFDTDTMHSTVSLTNRVTINTAGLYLVTGTFQFALNGTGERRAILKVNATTYIGFGQTAANLVVGSGLTIASVWKFAVADYVELRVQQTSGGALNIDALAAYSPEFTATWIGLG